jgi:hypothetical protein
MWMHTDKDYSRTIHHPLDVNGTSGRIINIADVMATPLKFELTQAVTLLSIYPELLQVRGWNILFKRWNDVFVPRPFGAQSATVTEASL